MRLQVATRYGKNKSQQVNSETLINLYAEQTSGLSNVTLHSAPALVPYAAVGRGPIRGMIDHGGVLHVVSGPQLYSVVSGVSTLVGTIAGTAPVSMASSGTQLVIVADSRSYLYETTLDEITDPDFVVASGVAYLDTYFIFSAKDSGQFFISTAGDGATYDALDFATAESNPDNLIAPFTDHRELLLFGSDTVEPWSNTGNNLFPFERIDGAIAEKGLGSAQSLAQIDNTVFWLDSDGIVRRLGDGYSPIRISTHEVEQALVNYVSQCTAFTFTFEGHEFYCITCANGTFVYDAATQLWHQRKTHNLTRWRAEHSAKVGQTWYVGDYSAGKVYTLSGSTYAEDGVDMVAQVVFPPIHAEGRRFRVHKVELEAERGTSVLGSPTKVRLDISPDGSTWNALEYKDLGGLGNTTHSTEWRRLGQHKRLHIRLTISDPAPRAIYGAYAEIEADG